MNESIVRQLATQIAYEAIISNWKFYALLLAISLLASAIGAYLKGHFTKRGEVAATKADAEAILQQLREATAATKAVELSLAHGDWIKRELNVLKRLKLEQLIVAAYSIAKWTQENGKTAMTGKEMDSKAPVEDFLMLSQLYFPELKAKSDRVGEGFTDAVIKALDLRMEIFPLNAEIEVATARNDRTKMLAMHEKRMEIQGRYKDNIVALSYQVHTSVGELAQASHVLMQELTCQA
jgi:hypothetical protein